MPRDKSLKRFSFWTLLTFVQWTHVKKNRYYKYDLGIISFQQIEVLKINNFCQTSKIFPLNNHCVSCCTTTITTNNNNSVDMGDYSQSCTSYYKGNSCSSRVNNNDNNNCSEESGWTMYLDDFDNDFHLKDGSFFASGCESSCLVSGAACSAIRDGSGDASLCKSRTNLIMERRRSKAGIVDKELEDTASSPSHSPKLVCDMNQSYMNSNGLDSRDVYQAYNSNNFQNHQQTAYDHSPCFSQKKRRKSQDGVGGVEMDCMETQLRRKGLCLVPMSSMLLDYLT